MSTPAKYRLHQSIGYQLSVTSRLQERRLDENLKAIGLTRIFWCILLAVCNEQLVHPSDIAEFVGIDRTATSRALRGMENAGMIARQSGGNDRRMRAVEMTEHGMGLLEMATPFANSSNDVIEQALSADALEGLRDVLAKLRDIEDKPLPRL
ncbi:MAG: MarR family transcriptional regulator [Marinosulfonomonas sp.]|nr:MarR family transcriptional regulator [Marinosulfonomonas sp.]